MTACKSMGIDPSSKTGLALVDANNQVMYSVVQFKDQKGLTRLKSIEQRVDQFVETWKPDIAVIEGYGFASKSLALMVEIGVLIRFRLQAHGVPWYIAPPATLKKWTTGNGGAKKELMAQAVVTRWHFDCPSDDVVDAYALARMGLTLSEHGMKAIPGTERGS